MKLPKEVLKKINRISYRNYSKKEIFFIVNNFKKMYLKDIAKKLNKSEQQIRGTLKRLKLTKVKRYPKIKKGMKFGSLTAIKRSHTKGNYTYWLYKCDCGKNIKARIKSVNYGETRSCGCKQFQNNEKRRLKSIINEIYGTYIRNARYRKLKFKISKKFFISLIKSNCHYCGIEPSSVYKKQFNRKYSLLKEPFKYNGIDRIDSNKSYTKDNVVPCCITCNRAKMATPKEEFYKWIKRLINHNKDLIK